MGSPRATQAVNDDADGRADLSLARHGPVVGIVPELAVCQVLVIDDDEEVEVRKVTADRIVDPIASCIRSVEDDLENLAVLEPLGPTRRDRVLERGPDHLDDVAQLRLLWQRQMIERLLHSASLPDGTTASKA